MDSKPIRSMKKPSAWKGRQWYIKAASLETGVGVETQLSEGPEILVMDAREETVVQRDHLRFLLDRTMAMAVNRTSSTISLEN